jgi:spermidine synthase
MVGGLVQSINANAPDVEERIWGRLAQSAKGKVQNCLILGLGGGTVAHLLTKKLGPIPIDGVEIDPLMVEVGKKFFDLDKLPNLNIITADAVDLISRQQFSNLTIQQYDLIIVDLYCGPKYPTGAESLAFFTGLKRLTHPSGVIVFNRISGKCDADVEEKLRKTFGQFEKKLVPSKFGGENIVYQVFPNQRQRGDAVECKPHLR